MQRESPQKAGLDIELAPEAASVGMARTAVGDYAQEAGAREDDVKLAVSESVGNAVVHAFPGMAEGRITVSARIERNRLLVTVADNGMGMQPRVDSPGLGLGIALITKVALEVTFDSSADGTTVLMAFTITP